MKLPCSRACWRWCPAHRALQAGFDHHLVKPVKPDELDRPLTEL